PRSSQARLFVDTSTASGETYTPSLHDALPISRHAPPDRGVDLRPCARGAGGLRRAGGGRGRRRGVRARRALAGRRRRRTLRPRRSEEHTSELQSRENLVCRLLLEKKTDPHYAP